MIEFKCQHCGKALHLNDSYAGRDGWCRVCKRMVIVPGGGGRAVRVEDLPPEEGYERLQRLLQYAATKADKYKVYLSRQMEEEQRTAMLEAALKQSGMNLAALEADLTLIRSERDEALVSLQARDARVGSLEAALAEAEAAQGNTAEIENLRAALEAERSSRQSLEADLMVRDASEAALRAEIEALRLAAEEQRNQDDTAAAERASLRALEGSVASLKSHIQQVEEERDRLALTLEEGALGAGDRARLLRQKDKEITVLQGTLAELRAQQEEASRSTRAQIEALEEQVLLFNEVKERLGALQEKIRALEQERLDATLALDAARHGDSLAQTKITALEAALRQSAEEQAAQAVLAEHAQRDLAFRDEQVRRLTAELQSATESQGAVLLEHEKSSRTARTAELRAERLAADLEALHQVQSRTLAENESLRSSAAELEARAASLAGALRQAREESAAQEAHQAAAAEARAELSMLRDAYQRLQESAAAEKAGLNHAVAELQAEIMNLSQAMGRGDELATEESLSLRESVALAEAEAARERGLAAQYQSALADARTRVAELETALVQRDELASLQQVEEEHLAQSLSEARARAEALSTALAQAGAAGTGDDADEGEDELDDGSDAEDDDRSFILLSPEASAPSSFIPPDAVDERRRQLEKQQMMEALSDFLDK